MKGLFARGACAAFLACLLFAVRAKAEMTLEVFAGGKHFQATPGNTVPVNPVDMAPGPGGTLTVVDGSTGKILSFDPATSTVTTLPNSPDYPEYRYLGPLAISYGPDVLNLYAGMEMWQINLAEGYSQYFGVVSSRGEAYMLAPDGTMYFSRYDDHRIFTRTTSGVVAPVPGAGDTFPDFRGDGTATAGFNNPRGVIFDAAGNMYVADSGNNRVRKRAAGTGIYSTIAGTGASNYNGDNLPAKQVNLNTPTKLAIDSAGNLYIFEAGTYVSGGARIRKLNASTGRITNFAGNGTWDGAPGNGGLAVNASLSYVADMEVVNGTLYFAEQSAYRIRKVDASGIITQVMGNGYGAFCGEGVPARQACLYIPSGVALDGAGNIYIADRGNARIRKISATTNLITTIAGGATSGPDGDGGPALAARFQNVLGDIAVDAARNVYVRDGNRIRRIDAASGIISTVAGAVSSGFAGDGGPASAARFDNPTHIAFDRSGNLYISDQWNNRVRRIDAATGIITTVAGNGMGNGPLGDGGPATDASIWQSDELAFDPAGNLLIGDVYHSSIRKVDRNTGVITTIAGNGSYNIGGDGGPALSAGLGFRFVFAVDPAGNIYITSSYEFRRIDAQTGIIDKAPAPIWGLVTPDHMVLEGATDIVLSADNHFYIADARTNNVVFRVNGVPTAGSDVTPPLIEPVLTGTLGDNGWYRSNVHLTWKITDPESGIIDKVDCLDVDLTYDVDGHDYSCRASSGGGVSQKYIRVKRDVTPPTLTFGAINPAPGANGWSNADASIPFTTRDVTSGVYSTSSGSPLTFHEEGAGLTQQVTVTDAAGNSATFTSPVVNIDRTAPLITASVTGTAGNAGWYRGDVQVTWTIDDAASLISSDGCEATVVAEDTAGTTLTCTATSPGGTASRSVTIKRDATPPTLTFGEAMPAADAKGWRMAPVAVYYEALDATSGVAAGNTPNPLPIVGTGAGVTAPVTVFDVAGNSATFTSPAYNIDASAPAISYSISGTLGANGWYRSDVRVTWQVSEPDSETHLEGCEDALVTSDTAGITFSCTAASTGGIANQSVTIKRDATPPLLNFGAGSPAANGAGWNTTDVSFPFTTSDATSGVMQTSRVSPVTVLGDGPGQTVQVIVADNAGNEATFSTPPVNIDRVAPIINFVVNGTPGNNGWYTSDVQVTWQVSKAPESILSRTGCQDSSVTTDTSGTTFSCAVASGAGAASSSVTIKRDATPPVLTFGAPSPVPNTSGWNKTNVSIPFTRSDALSGLASTSVASPLVISAEGAGITGQVVVTDKAGNVATFTSVTRNIDKTAPVVDFPTPADGADFGLFQEAFADYSCDDISLVSCTSTIAQGDYVTRSGGSKSMKVTAKNAAGFTTITPIHYFSVDTLFNWNGFEAPASEPPALNLVTRGALVPIRWQLPDGHGGYVRNTASFVSATVATLSCGSASVVPYGESSGSPEGISFDDSNHTFTYNWATSADWTGCRKLTIKLKDNTTHVLRFKFQ
jgi:hypothetical protein